MSTPCAFAYGSPHSWRGTLYSTHDGSPASTGPELWAELKKARRSWLSLREWGKDLGGRVTNENAHKQHIPWVYLLDYNTVGSAGRTKLHILYTDGKRGFTRVATIDVHARRQPDWAKIEREIYEKERYPTLFKLGARARKCALSPDQARAMRRERRRENMSPAEKERFDQGIRPYRDFAKSRRR